MRSALILGLVALITASSALAQGLSQALPTVFDPVTLLTTQSVAGTTSVTSDAVADPVEIVSLDYDGATSPAGFASISVTVYYSDSVDGPWVSPSDTLSSGAMSSVTFNVTPTSGSDFHAYPAKYAKFKFTNGSSSTMTLNRLTGLRKHVASTLRPQALVDRVINLGLDATVLTNGSTSSFSSSKSNPSDIKGFFWDRTGSTGSGAQIQLFYSNSSSGPFVAWEDQSVEAVAYQNTVTKTAKQIFFTAKPFPAAYVKFKVYNNSGASTTLNRLTATRREQVRR